MRCAAAKPCFFIKALIKFNQESDLQKIMLEKFIRLGFKSHHNLLLKNYYMCLISIAWQGFPWDTWITPRIEKKYMKPAYEGFRASALVRVKARDNSNG
jgi:hypothetical protein